MIGRVKIMLAAAEEAVDQAFVTVLEPGIAEGANVPFSTCNERHTRLLIPRTDGNGYARRGVTPRLYIDQEGGIYRC